MPLANGAHQGTRSVTTFIIILFILAILGALFSGLYFLIRDRSSSQDTRLVKALSWRVGLQVLLIAFLALAYFMGWIHPHGVSG